MIRNFASDVPKELIQILNRCDFGVIPVNQQDAKLEQLRSLASKYMNRKPNMANVRYVEIEVNNCPPKLINLINQMDFASINILQRKLAIPIIQKYLKDQGIYK